MSLFFSLLFACAPEKSFDSASGVDSASEPLTSFLVTGQVVDIDGNAVPQAMVMVGGQSDEHVLSDFEGHFELNYDVQNYGEPAIVAAKQGYRATGYEFFEPNQSLLLRLRPIDPSDNIEYEFMEPGDGFDALNEDCSHCHTSFVAEFQQSKHADAAENPLLHDLYTGVFPKYSDQQSCEAAGGRWALGIEPGTANSHVEKCYMEAGVLSALNENCGDISQPVCDAPDLEPIHQPQLFGACADCHAPGIDGVAGGRDLHDAVGIAYTDGVHCDVCHKVQDVDLNQPPGIGQRLKLGRPVEAGMTVFEFMPVFYGPLIDVPNVIMGGAWQPQFNASTFCAGCHEQEQPALIPGQSLNPDKWPNGLPIHSTYSEWEAGPYNQDETQCQFCHMPANTERTNSVDIANDHNASITFGFPREPEDNRRHLFKGPLDGESRMIDRALYVSLKTEVDANQLTISTSVSNIGAGHAIPTGEPMRALHVTITATGGCGTLLPKEGPLLTDTGGVSVSCEIGQTCSIEGMNLTGFQSDRVDVGQRIRIVRPTGDYLDYVGPGYFGNANLTSQQKGIPLMQAVSEATILSVDVNQVLLDTEITAFPGDIIYFGDPYSGDLSDGEVSRHLAGYPGMSFSKVLIDSHGERHVPHFKAVDIVSDNRLLPGSNVVFEHVYDLPANCDTGSVSAQLLYRPIPLNLATPRGWEAIDYVVAEAQEAF